MKTVYVLDTNVLLQDPHSIFSFQQNEVVIPSIVLEEVDSKKRQMDEVGSNARQFSRMIDLLRERGRLHEGVSLDHGGTLRVELNHQSYLHVKDRFAEMTNDNRIIAVALNLKLEEEEKKYKRDVKLVSKDTLVRVKADALGVHAEDFLSDRVVEIDHLYTGFSHAFVKEEIIQTFYQQHSIPSQQCEKRSYQPHEFIIMKDQLGGSGSAIGKVCETGQNIEALQCEYEQVWGIKARNAQQRMAFELLLREDIPLVTMIGKAGTGKTLLALAAGLMQTEDLRKYKKLVVARPIVPLGKDIGYLPGEKEEKLRPWMQPIYDNLEFLFDTKKQEELDRILLGIGSIEVEPLTYIRGRSIPDQFIIIDEAQNLTKHEMKTILTRVGDRSKIIFMGDPEQIDHPYLDSYNNGLSYVVEKFKQQAVSGHIKLIKGERSNLAQIAADVL